MYEVAENILESLESIEYGWLDSRGNIYFDGGENMFSGNYILQSPEQLSLSHAGVCWDQVELERKLFADHHIEADTYFISYHNNKNECYNHTFLVFHEDGKSYWLEHSWLPHQGIHQYNSLDGLLFDVKNKWIANEQRNGNPYIKDDENLYIYQYTQPKYGIGVEEFLKHTEGGILLTTMGFSPFGENPI